MSRVSQHLAGNLYVPPVDVPHYAQRVAFEQVAMDILARRALIEGCMRHEDSNDGRGTVDRMSGTVNATTIRASAPVRVRDSHDARAANERSKERPYSERAFLRDVAECRRPLRETWRETRVPAWVTELLLDHGGHFVDHVREPDWSAMVERIVSPRWIDRERTREPREGSTKPRAEKPGEARAARLRAIADRIVTHDGTGD